MSFGRIKLGLKAKGNSWKFIFTCWRLPSALRYAVPKLTPSGDIKLNERVLLRRPFELLTFSQSRGLARR
jgi:hypothetical protein